MRVILIIIMMLTGYCNDRHIKLVNLTIFFYETVHKFVRTTLYL